MPDSKQQQVYAALKSRILAGTYGPGTRLVLAALARELDVSPVPVREAIRRLEAEGWLEYTRNVGATVEAMSAETVEQALQTLALAEGFATALAARHVAASDLAAARRLNAAMARSLDPLDAIELSSLDRRFHVSILERCPNEHLNGIVRQELGRLDAMRGPLLVAIPRRARASVEEHEALLALLERDAEPADIELAARAHRLCLLESFREGIQPGGSGV
jgi:DNA-binding GntR family transcriptional regulator